MSDHSADQRSQDRFTEMTRVAKRSQVFGISVIVVAALLVAVISTAVSVWNVTELHHLNNDTRQLLKNDVVDNVAREVQTALEQRQREFDTPSLRCILEQLSEHRHLNALAHRAEAGVHGYSYPIPPDEEPPPVSDAETVCAPFFKEGEGR